MLFNISGTKQCLLREKTDRRETPKKGTLDSDGDRCVYLVTRRQRLLYSEKRSPQHYGCTHTSTNVTYVRVVNGRSIHRTALRAGLTRQRSITTGLPVQLYLRTKFIPRFWYIGRHEPPSSLFHHYYMGLCMEMVCQRVVPES